MIELPVVLNKGVLIVWSSSVIICGFMIAKYLELRKAAKEKEIPKKWRKVGEISEILAYPLKSGKPLSLQEAECTPRGLKSHAEDTKGLRDRFFMVVGAVDREFKRSVNYPKMILITTKSKGDGFVTFSAPDVEDIVVKIPDISNGFVDSIMWFGEKVEGIDCGDAAATWFSKCMMDKETGVRLLFCITDDNKPARHLDKSPWKEFFKFYKMISIHDVGGFSDVFSYMMLSESSVSHLRRCLPEGVEITAKQFRPNLVVKGSLQPFEEDDWKWVKVNDIVFRKGNPCLRCPVININPETAVSRKDFEPLKTLETFRCAPETEINKIECKSPEFGTYLGMRSSKSGNVKIGDPVYVSVDSINLINCN